MSRSEGGVFCPLNPSIPRGWPNGASSGRGNRWGRTSRGCGGLSQSESVLCRWLPRRYGRMRSCSSFERQFVRHGFWFALRRVFRDVFMDSGEAVGERFLEARDAQFGLLEELLAAAREIHAFLLERERFLQGEAALFLLVKRFVQP